MSVPLNLASAAELVDICIQNVFSYPSADRNEKGRVRNAGEYEAYNRQRLAKYAAEDSVYRFNMNVLGIVFWFAIAMLLITLTR